jgi:hypothetical protein
MKSKFTISPKLAGAIGPPLTAVVTAMILTDTVDRTSLAALAAILIGAVLGYHAPGGKTGVYSATTWSPMQVAESAMSGTMGAATGDWRKGVPIDTGEAPERDDESRAIPDNPDQP